MSASAQSTNQRELDVILELVKERQEIKKPIPIIAGEVMLNRFGWPSDGPNSLGYKRARLAILELETHGDICCVRSSQGNKDS